MASRSSIVKPDAPITVMGLGRFGGGVGVTRWLCEHLGCRHVLVTDLETEDTLAASLAAIEHLVRAGQVRLRLGRHEIDDFTRADLVIANPAVPKPWDNAYLAAARKARVPIVTEIQLLLDLLPSREHIIGVTGSAGKSTTAAMIHHALTALGHHSHFGGNIGGSLLHEASAGAIGPEDWVVLELSSAMLYWIGRDDSPVRISPHIGVITNIQPNHLDWHRDFEHYQQCKANLIRFQKPGDIAILSDQAQTVLSANPSGMPGRGRLIVVGAPEHGSAQQVALRIPGTHNVHNALVASAAIEAAIGIQSAEVITTLTDFPGLPHRLCCIQTDRDNRRFFDDSKSTTPAATRLAVESFAGEAGRIHLIAGGYDKGQSNEPIASLMPTLAGIYTIGDTGPTLATQCKGASPDSADRVYECGNLETAFQAAVERMKAGDVLLLSPGHASWDQFTNYIERGKRFAELTLAWIKSTTASTPIT